MHFRKYIKIFIIDLFCVKIKVTVKLTCVTMTEVGV